VSQSDLQEVRQAVVRVRLMIDVETHDWQLMSDLVKDQVVVKMHVGPFHVKLEDGQAEPVRELWGRLIGAEEAYDSLIQIEGNEP
jgi:hypothetical protein